MNEFRWAMIFELAASGFSIKFPMILLFFLHSCLMCMACGLHVSCMGLLACFLHVVVLLRWPVWSAVRAFVHVSPHSTILSKDLFD